MRAQIKIFRFAGVFKNLLKYGKLLHGTKFTGSLFHTAEALQQDKNDAIRFLCVTAPVIGLALWYWLSIGNI